MKKLLMGLFLFGIVSFGFQTHAFTLNDALLQIKSLQKEIAEIRSSLGASAGYTPVTDGLEPTGVLTASPSTSCNLEVSNRSNCGITLNWNVLNALSGSSIKLVESHYNLEDAKYLENNISTKKTGSEYFSIDYNTPKTFSLYHNNIKLNEVTLRAVCPAGVNMAWNQIRQTCEYATISISGVSGPQTLKVNQKGTWTVTASDTLDKNLSYSVNWGDTGLVPSTLKGGIIEQTSIFTHTYTKAGLYKVIFTVSNSSGQSTTSEVTVLVGGLSLQAGCESGYRYSVITGQLCTQSSAE